MKEYHKYKFCGNRIYKLTDRALSSIDITKILLYLTKEVEASCIDEAIKKY